MCVSDSPAGTGDDTHRNDQRRPYVAVSSPLCAPLPPSHHVRLGWHIFPQKLSLTVAHSVTAFALSPARPGPWRKFSVGAVKTSPRLISEQTCLTPKPSEPNRCRSFKQYSHGARCFSDWSYDFWKKSSYYCEVA